MATQQMAIANIERIDIITEQSPPAVLSFDTASDASAEAQISAGAEHELRIKNQILAQNITEDIVKGFNITFTDSTFSPDVFALVDGGESTVYDALDDDSGGSDEPAEAGFARYTAPTAGEVVSRVRSSLAIYASEKDYDGNTLSYTAFLFPHAFGKPASVKFKDGEFFAPSYTVKSRPSKGQSPMTVLSLPSMPVIVRSGDDLPASPVRGKTVILTAADDIAGLGSIPAGEYAIFNGTTYSGISG